MGIAGVALTHSFPTGSCLADPGCGAAAIAAGSDLAAPSRCRPRGYRASGVAATSRCHGAVMLPGSAVSRHRLLAVFVRCRPVRPLDGRMWPGGAGCAPIACPQRRHRDFLPLALSPHAAGRVGGPAGTRHSSRDKKVSSRRPPLRCGRKRCGSIASRPEARHRGRTGRPRASAKETFHGDHRQLHQGPSSRSLGILRVYKVA